MDCPVCGQKMEGGVCPACAKKARVYRARARRRRKRRAPFVITVALLGLALVALLLALVKLPLNAGRFEAALGRYGYVLAEGGAEALPAGAQACYTATTSQYRTRLTFVQTSHADYAKAYFYSHVREAETTVLLAGGGLPGYEATSFHGINYSLHRFLNPAADEYSFTLRVGSSVVSVQGPLSERPVARKILQSFGVLLMA